MKEYELKEEEITKSYEYEQFLEQVIGKETKNLAIIGEPGAGKTTWLTKIAEYLAKNPDYAFPICVSLSRLNQDSLEKYLLEIWLKEAIVFIPNFDIITTELQQDLIKQFNRKNIWLLLDDVDEMKEKDNPLSAISQQLQGFINNTRIILTCRLNVWQSNSNILANFDYYRTLVFNQEQVQDFILQWFGKSDQPLLGETLDQELIKSENARILDLVKNPLRLAMLCQSWYFEQGNLPETKASLYKQFVKVFYQWKQDAFPTTYQQRQNLHKALGNLALKMLDESVSLTESVVREILTDDEFNLATQLGWLNLVYRNRNEEDVFAFFHFTFAEYFAACTIDDWDYFLPKDHVNKPVNSPLACGRGAGGEGKYRIFEKQWKEIYLLWMGREDINSNEKESLIEKLVNFNDRCGEFNLDKVDRGFYEYQAYFKATIGISEFKSCSLADEIVKQVVKFAFDWSFYHISESAREVLPESDRQRVITELIDILQTTESKDTRSNVVYSLEEIAVGNEKVIASLISILETTDNEDIHREVADILGKIAVGNERAITTLISILQTTEYPWRVAEILENIAVGNEKAIATLISILQTTESEDTREKVADILEKIIKTKTNYLMTVSALNKHLNNETYQNNYNLYINCYKLLWKCAENLTYPEFYQAWHQPPTYHPEMADFQPSSDTATLKQLESQITDISQLQPTANRLSSHH